jgi:hypothetical protein
MEYTKKLESVGFTRDQIEVGFEMLNEFTKNNLASKEDLDSFKKEFKHTIEILEYKLTIKMGSMLILAVGILVALQKLV